MQSILDSLQEYGVPEEYAVKLPVVVVLALTLVATIVVYERMTTPTSSSTKRQDPNKESRNQTSREAAVKLPAPASNNTTTAKNCVWEERRKRGISENTSGKKENASGDKPFGSSYYYAHNSTNAKGGYADGLRMEDFTMNGPRLLSKNGVYREPEAEAVADDIIMESKDNEGTPANTTTIKSNANSDTSTTRAVTPPRPNSSKNSKVITKYLWDDPGDASGIATIRIDTLPGKTSTETLAWKDANIETVSATLQNEGLLVVATSSSATSDNDSDGTQKLEYRLHIPRLYDQATEVKTVVKTKRLLVKIQKQRNALNYLGVSNIEPWPHPHRKGLGPPIID